MSESSDSSSPDEAAGISTPVPSFSTAREEEEEAVQVENAQEDESLAVNTMVENQATNEPDTSNSIAEEEEEVFHDSVQHEDEDEVIDDLDKMNLENSHCDQEESDIGLETEVAEKEEATETIDDTKMEDGTVEEVVKEEQSEEVNDEENKSEAIVTEETTADEQPEASPSTNEESIPASPTSHASEFNSDDRQVTFATDKSVSPIPCFVNPTTPIPNSDSALRLLRKFVNKTAKFFPSSCGGTKSSSILSFLFGGSTYDDECNLAYKNLVDVLISGVDESEELDDSIATGDGENDIVVESILGHSGDTMSKARSAIACFCYLFEMWSLETQRMSILQMGSGIAAFEELVNKTKFHDYESMDQGYVKSQVTVIKGEVMAAALTCAEALVAHGCFDGVQLSIGQDDQLDISVHSLTLPEDDEESNFKAVSILCESVYNCFLETEEAELAAIKFLLTTGCRTTEIITSDGTKEITAMLQGTHLLQAIRVCYRLYLSTESSSNKTTAKAALRQIVTSTFKRLENKKESPKSERPGLMKQASIEMLGPVGEDPFSHEGFESEGKNLNPTETDDMTMKSRLSSAGNFPSFEHKDAYLVLRSLCKLSMKAVSTDPQTSYLSTPVVIARNESSGPGDDPAGERINRDFPTQPIMMDPALDSKILALDLILEILQRTKTDIFMNAGHHLIYAVRNYLCHSLLKNCTLDNTYVVSLSLQLFVPLIRHFRAHLKTEIEAFVTNVFFVILDSKNSTVEHKLRVVILFEEVCSDPATLAEIFLNYDCDLSAVDLFQRIVNTLARVAKIGLHDQGMESAGIFVGGAGATRAEKARQDHRALRLEAMKAVRKILSSLLLSMTSAGSFQKESLSSDHGSEGELKIDDSGIDKAALFREKSTSNVSTGDEAGGVERQSLVQIFDSKKKRKEDFAKVILKFNQKPKAGIQLAAEVGLLNPDDPSDVAQFLLTHKDSLDKTQTGEFLGMDTEYKDGFMLKVLHQYANAMDFTGLRFDDAIKLYLSGFRLPGEAQKIDRIMEKFAERYTIQNSEIFPTADAAFILAFSVIMLNTDLHNPAIKEERRMTKEGFLRNNSGICDGQDLPEEFLTGIFDRIKTDPISLKEDDEAREKAGGSKPTEGSSKIVLFTNNYQEIDKKRETNYQKERDEILRNTESLLRRKSSRGKTSSSKRLQNFVSTEDSGLKDEYVIPMYDVTWGPALAVFSTVIESANGTMGALLSIATDDEIESAAENAAEATEVCLDGFTLAIRIASLCGNDTARCAYVHALSNFSLLGTGRMLEHRHIRCVQTLLELGRDYGEYLGSSWEYIFKALSEVARLNHVYEEGAKFARAELAARARKKKREEAAAKKAAKASEEVENEDNSHSNSFEESDNSSYDSEFDDDFDELLLEEMYEDHFGFDEELDKIALDEINARSIHENLPEELSDEIFSRSSSLSTTAIKDFIFQLCRVSRMEISGYGGGVGSKANNVDLTAVHYRKNHSLVDHSGSFDGRQNQPDIFSLQKLVEVTHYNMDTRPRLVFSDIWNIVSGHLTSTALHSNAAVAMYAVDSFRQLGMQFLKREELGVFEFQRKFIKPFEGVMLKCKNSSIKEFLLKSVEQIIVLYGDTNPSIDNIDQGYKGLLKSGWRPLLAVIGQSSCDEDDAIAKLGFSMLTAQLRQSLKVTKSSEHSTGESAFAAASPMRADKFVDLVEALLMFVSGPREEMSTESIDHLVTLSRYLSDESIPLPQNTKPSHLHPVRIDGPDTAAQLPSQGGGVSGNEELELWWPILLGLSKSVGDVRPNIRIKGLVTLLAIINQHFFVSNSEGKKSSVLGDLQTLQLIFRGVLTPSLEHADSSSFTNGVKLTLPDGFIRFMTRGSSISDVGKGGRKDRIEGQAQTSTGNNWLDTTFDHLMDGAIAIVLRSIEVYNDDILIEEILAMFNTCLISDSTSLSIRGLKRLYHFIANDLVLENITDSTWATVSHMLRRCLAVSGIPFNPDNKGNIELNSEIINDFLQEEQYLPQRRYIGSNVTSIIGSFLTDPDIARSMGPQWYIFLYSGLGAGIRVWDKAAEIVDMHPLHSGESKLEIQPPQYAENSLYARKWLGRLLLKLIAGEDLMFGENSTSDALCKGLLKDEVESLINSYLKKEAAVATGTMTPGQSLELEHMTKMVCNLLEGISNLESERLTSISSLTPVLSACIQTDDRNVRTSVHKLLQRIFQMNESKE